METTKKQTSNPWGLLIIVLILATAPPAALFKIASVQTTMMNSLGLTSTQVGLLSSAFSLASVVMAIPGGLIAAKFGNWKTGLQRSVAADSGPYNRRHRPGAHRSGRSQRDQPGILSGKARQSNGRFHDLYVHRLRYGL